jgi:hypothetical protein
MSRYDPEFDAMDDATFVDAMTPPMESVITACFYRVLGQSSLPFNIKQIERFINLQGKNIYGGDLVPIVSTNQLHLYLWKNCDVSHGHGITFNVYVWGIPNARNTVFTRKYWWGCYVLRSKIESILKVPSESLRIREKISLF